jgi:outer membrane usher protein
LDQEGALRSGGGESQGVISLPPRASAVTPAVDDPCEGVDQADDQTPSPREPTPYDRGYDVPHPSALLGADVSFSMDTNAFYERVEIDGTRTPVVDETVTVSLLPALRLQRLSGLYLEADLGFIWQQQKGLGASFEDPGVEEWAVRRGPVRAVLDNEALATRLQAGDIAAPSVNFQTFSRLLGVGYSRAYSDLQPFRSVYAGSRRSFFLETPALVEVFANGQFVGEQRLLAGQYDLDQVAPEYATQSIRLLIRDATGRRSDLQFSQFTGTNLLARGVVDFAVQAGFVSDFFGDTIEYDFSEPQFSGYVRAGVSDSITLGADLQADRRTVVVGGSFGLGLGLSALEIGAALSHDEAEGAGLAVRADMAVAEVFPDIGLAASFTHYSRAFRGVQGRQPGGDVEFDGTVSVDASVLPRVNLSAGLSATQRYGFQDEAAPPVNYAGFASAQISLRRGSTLGVIVSADNAGGGSDEGDDWNISARLALRIRLGGGIRASAQYDSLNTRYTGQISRSELRNVNDWSGQLRVTGAQEPTPRTNISGFASYGFDRAYVTLAHSETVRNSQTRSAPRVSSLSIDTSFAYADGALAWGRSVGDGGFVIVQRPADGAEAYVNYSGPGDYLARTSKLGNALVGNVQTLRNEVFAIERLEAGGELAEATGFGQLIEVEPGVFAESPDVVVPVLDEDDNTVRVFLRRRVGARVILDDQPEVSPGQ